MIDGDVFDRAVGAIVSARQVQVYGHGIRSEATADILNSRLVELEVPSSAYTKDALMPASTRSLGPGTVAIGVSHTGTAAVIVATLGEARAAGTTTVCLTGGARSPVTDVSDLALVYAAEHPVQPGDIAVGGRLAGFAVIEALCGAVGLRQYRGVSEDAGSPGGVL